eukprot:5892930-Pyramimonas_sp.AAC.1
MCDFVRGLPNHVPSCEVNALMLDGAILRVQESSIRDLQKHMGNVGSKHSVFDRLGGAKKPLPLSLACLSAERHAWSRR